MGTAYPEMQDQLRARFDNREVKNRAIGGGKFADYVGPRTVANRLDAVFGWENWSTKFIPGNNSVICELTVRLPDGREVTKSDAGAYATMSSNVAGMTEGDDEKGGFSDAFKRAAVHFGVFRHGYPDGEDFGIPSPGHQPPPRVDPPSPTLPPPARVAPLAARQPMGNYDNFKLPPPGKAVFAWAKFHEHHFQVTTVDWMRDCAGRHNLPTNFTTWDQAAVNLVCGELIEYLKKLDAYKGEFDSLTSPTPTANMPVGPNVYGPFKAIKLEIVELAKEVCRLSNENPEDRQAVSRRIQEISAACCDSKGEIDREVGLLSKCQDGVWLENMKVQAGDILKILTSGVLDDMPF